MPKAIALIRVSTEHQAGPDRAGPAAQRVECERIAAAHGLEVVEIVELEGVSGAAVLADPRFRRLLERLSEPDIEGVIVREPSRLMRPERLSDYMVLEAFRAAGKLIYTPEGPRDLRTFSGRLMSVLQGEMDAHERRTIRERTQKAKEVHRRSGRLVEGPQTLPRGVTYRNETGPDGAVRPVWGYDPATAAPIREAYRRLLAGERNMAQIARDIGWASGGSNLRRTLLNPIYQGIRRIDRRKVGGTVQPRPAGEVIELRVIDEGLVSPAEWEAVRAILSERRAPPRRSARERPHVFLEVARCASCGSRMIPWHPVQGHPAYRCTASQKWGVGYCPTGSITHRAVDPAGDAAVREHLARPEVIAPLLEAAMVGERGAAPLDAEQAKKRADELRRERGRVVTAYERGLRTLTDTEARCRELDGQIELLAALAAERPAEPETSPHALALRLCEPFAEWGHLSLGQKRKLLRAAVQAVHVRKMATARARVDAIDLRLSPAIDTHGGGAIATRALRVLIEGPAA